MRIVFVDPAPLDGARTESLQFLQLAEAVAGQGAHVTLVTPLSGTTQEPAEILGRLPSVRLKCEFIKDPRQRLVYRLAGLGRSSKPFLRNMNLWLAEKGCDFDYVYVRNLKLAESILREEGHPKIVYHAHEHFGRVFRETHLEKGWRRNRKLCHLLRREKLVATSVDGIVATVQAIIDDLRGDYGAIAPAIVVPNGVDLAGVEKCVVKPSSSKKIRAMYLGSLHPWKGVGTLIHAMATVCSEVELEIAGGLPQQIAMLKDLAASIGVSSSVHFLGPIPPAERFSVIASADITLLPLIEKSGMASRYTSPLKIFEYMALGKPIVASDLPSIRSILRNRCDSVLVPPDSPDDWSKAMTELAGSAELRRDIGERARINVQNCSWAKRADVLAHWLESGRPPRD